VYTQIICPNSTACSNTVCKPSVGCYTTNLTCNDNSACTKDSCDPVKGCVYDPITCDASTDYCQKSFCDDEIGCFFASIDYTTECNITAENCTVPACNGTCYNKYICYTAPPSGDEGPADATVAIASALTTAAVIGIVIGAVLLVAGLGGGAVVAVAGGAGAGGVTAVFSNPVYSGSDTEGNNPLNVGT
jgi:hypothetical protein